MAHTVVDSVPGVHIPWKELWAYRELFFFLAWKDFLVRYKQTIVGILWAVLEPLLRMVVLTFVFSKIAKLESSSPVLVFAGVIPWQFFRQSLNSASLCIVNNTSMVSKVYFPRLILPASSVVVNWADVVIGLAILFCMMPFEGHSLSLRILVLPPLILLASLFAMGLSFFISALYVKYRDFKLVLPFLLEIGMFLTPVGYNLEVVQKTLSPELFFLYSLNPMVGIVAGFRWCILGQPITHGAAFGFSTLVVCVLFWYGLRYFRKSERWFADYI